MNTHYQEKNFEQTVGAGCCGGPVSLEVDACCDKDATAKAGGGAGCGCSNAPVQSDIPTSACCGLGGQVQKKAMKELNIEWRHYDKDGQTCDRCAATGASVREVVSGLSKELAEKGVSVTFTETLLSEELIAQSNIFLFNGVPLEAVLDNAAAGENHCASCSCLTGSETSCRTVEYEGTTYEAIPEDLIRKAAYKAISRYDG